MTDPLDALREPARAVDPDQGFATRLRERLERLVLAGDEEPPVTTTEPRAESPQLALPAVTPYLTVPDARAAVDFYVEAFDAERRGDPIVMPDGRIGHAEIALAGTVVMLAEEFPEIGLRAPASGAVAVSLRLETADPDAVVDRAVAHGATLERPVADSPYGRGGVVVDPAGHRWMVSRSPGTGMRAGEIAYSSLWTRDAGAAERFYSAVLGWTTRGEHEHREVTNLSAPTGIFGGQEPTLFCCYAVADLDAAVRLVRAAGGSADEPVSREYGRVADCTDDQGRRFALTEVTAGAPRSTTGPGELAYVTLEFPDSARARAFYGTVLGWTFVPGRRAGNWNVRLAGTDPRPPTGIAGGREPGAVPMFAVPDVHAAVARVRAAGGTASEPEFAGYGTASTCLDDQGARFDLAQF